MKMEDNQELNAKMRRRIRELDMARRGFVLGIVVWCVLAFVFDSQGQQVQKWAVTPSVKLNNAGSPYASVHVEAGIEEAIWAWSSRMPTMQIKYVGLTLAPVENAVITFRWMDPMQHFDLTDNLFAVAAERKWTYIDNGMIARSVIYLNSSYFTGGIGRCQLTAISHELGHAFGLRVHSLDPEDLMYWAPTHCRYTPTDHDIHLTGNVASACHAVLTRDNDIAVPDIAGQQAYLRYQGGSTWKLEYVAPKVSRACASAQFNSTTGAIVLPDLRGATKRYSARFESIGFDTWRLNNAEMME